jgi:AAA15 family ATPase/GTPase
MIKELSINNFKSIERLDLQCKRVNVFIGNPNTGKSNLLESLNLLNYHSSSSLKELVRLDNVSNLFTDYDLFQKIRIKADDLISESRVENEQFITETWKGNHGSPFLSRFSLDGKFIGGSLESIDVTPQIKPYKFNSNISFRNSKKTFLEVPDGPNLPTIILGRKELRSYIQDLLAELEYKLLINPIENRIEIYKEDAITIAFPFDSISDTVKRIIFYTAVIQSNKDSILVLEEPEAHIFPFYSNEIARQIVNDEGNNQFFIITHNPYLLQTLIEKTGTDELQVNISYTENYRTKVHQIMDEKSISELIDMESSAFFRFDEFIKQ